MLDVGCGSTRPPGAVGVDVSADTDADVVHDLDVFPYPFESSSFEHIRMQDVLEHLADPFGVLAELHRIGRPGARIQIRTPHFSSVLAYSDPTHRHAFSTQALRQLAEPGFSHYSEARFRVVRITIDMWLPYRVTGISALANRYAGLYERYFSFWFTAMNLRAEFEVIK